MKSVQAMPKDVRLFSLMLPCKEGLHCALYSVCIVCALSGVGVVSDTEREISTGHGSSCHSLGAIFILSPLWTSLEFWLRAETFNDHYLLEEGSIIGDS